MLLLLIGYFSPNLYFCFIFHIVRLNILLKCHVNKVNIRFKTIKKISSSTFLLFFWFHIVHVIKTTHYHQFVIFFRTPVNQKRMILVKTESLWNCFIVPVRFSYHKGPFIRSNKEKLVFIYTYTHIVI